MTIKTKVRKCATPRCRRVARSSRRFCNTCTKRKWCERHPIEYRYHNLRSHARARGKVITITIEHFTEFCLETKYHERSGREPDSATIDRRNPARGYEPGNIRILTHIENSTRQDDPEF